MAFESQVSVVTEYIWAGTRCTPKPKKQKGKAASAAVTDTLIRHLFAEQQQPQAEQSRTLIFWFFFLPYTYLLLLRNIPHYCGVLLRPHVVFPTKPEFALFT